MAGRNRFLTSPRVNPVNGFTMGGIAAAMGLGAERFRKRFRLAFGGAGMRRGLFG
jgi:hypothetical protein